MGDRMNLNYNANLNFPHGFMNNDFTTSINDVIKVEPPDEWTEYSEVPLLEEGLCPTSKDTPECEDPGSADTIIDKVSEVETFSDTSDCEGGGNSSNERLGSQPGSVASGQFECGLGAKDEVMPETGKIPSSVLIKREPVDTFIDPDGGNSSLGVGNGDTGEMQAGFMSICNESNEPSFKKEPTYGDETSCANDTNMGPASDCDNDTTTSQAASTEIDFADDKTYNQQVSSPTCSTVEQPEGVFENSFGYDDVDRKPHACTQCDKRFNKAKALRHHMRMHTGERPYSCQQCEKSFTRYSTLQNHRKTHQTGTPFHCNICDKKFKQSRHLQQHLRTHEADMPLAVTAPTDPGCPYIPLRKPPKPRPYICPICGKDFIRSFHLQRHTRAHTGERPFSCNTCGKSFRDTSCLHRHQRSHTGERPFECDICGERFMLSYHLQGHMMIHTGKRPYSCPTCNKDFMRLYDLHRHKMTHTGEKPYSCSLCGTLFSRSSALHRHLRRHTCPAPSKPRGEDVLATGGDTSGGEDGDDDDAAAEGDDDEEEEGDYPLTGIQINDVQSLATVESTSGETAT